ncbi:P-loop containing nucleoside triphosphate hydrolase protein [Peziza echinospora]|nr:P-loop containing nucleoside triphosphate hydrolase protein [Peziza echinospora]
MAPMLKQSHLWAYKNTWQCVRGMEMWKLPSRPSSLVVFPLCSRNTSSINQRHSSTSPIPQRPSDITPGHAFSRKAQPISFQKATGQVRKTHTHPDHDFLPEIDSDEFEIGKDDIIKPLTPEQAVALDVLKEGKNIFLTGPAGSGKSEIIKHMEKYLRANDMEPAVTASTGVAALSIGGQTLHSWSGLGKGDKPLSYYRDKCMWMKREMDEKSEMEVQEIYAMVASSSGVQDPNALQSTENSEDEMDLMVQLMQFQKMRKAEVLIVDEISMISPSLLEKLDIVLKASRGSEEPFATKLSDKNVPKLQQYNQLKSTDGLENTHQLTAAEQTYLKLVGVDHGLWTECSVKTDNYSHSYPAAYKDTESTGGIRGQDWAHDCEYTWNRSIAFCFQTPTWHRAHLHHIKLTKSMRQKDDLPFVHVLEKVKRGKVNEAHVRIFLDKMLLPLRGQVKEKNPLIMKLYTTNQNVKNENEQEYEKLDGKEYTYFAEDGGEYKRHFYEKNTDLEQEDDWNDDDEPRLRRSKREATVKFEITDISEETLKEHYFFEEINTDEKLRLKVGTQVMLLYNLSVKDQLVNGSQGLVAGFGDYSEYMNSKFRRPLSDLTLEYLDRFPMIPLVDFSAGTTEHAQGSMTLGEHNTSVLLNTDSHPGRLVPIFPIIQSKSTNLSPATEEHVYRVQIPLTWAWAKTIHKMQGQTLNLQAVAHFDPIFEHGQAYVGVSRVRKSEDLQIIPPKKSLRAGRVSWNKVFTAHPAVLYFDKYIDKWVEMERRSKGKNAKDVKMRKREIRFLGDEVEGGQMGGRRIGDRRDRVRDDQDVDEVKRLE